MPTTDESTMPRVKSILSTAGHNRGSFNVNRKQVTVAGMDGMRLPQRSWIHDALPICTSTGAWTLKANDRGVTGKCAIYNYTLAQPRV